MRAMIFAAGLGTRLKPLTDTMPKAMIPICGKPLLEHVVLKLKNAGFDHLVVNVHHFSDQIIRFLAENNNFGVKIDISDESDELLETGGGILKAKNFFDGNEPILIHNVDILSNLDVANFYAQAKQNESLATLLVSERESSRYLLFIENLLQGWVNVKTGETKPRTDIDVSIYEKFAFSGIHVVSPRIFDVMEQDHWQGKFSITDFYLAECQKHNISAFVGKDLQLLDVGKIDSLAVAEKFVLK